MRLSDSAPLRFAFGLLLTYLGGAALLFFFLDYQLTSTLTHEVDKYPDGREQPAPDALSR